MASREQGYGLTAELAQKKDGKFDAKVAQEAFNWIGSIVTDETLSSPRTQEDVKNALQDGYILAKLANAIKPGSVKVVKAKMAFQKMEVINGFLTFCTNVGLLQSDLFQTVDLYEGQNIPQVISTIHALGRKANSINSRIPSLGPKESSKNPRSFTDDQMKAGSNVIGLQMGHNRGANQAGMNFGLGRQIK